MKEFENILDKAEKEMGDPEFTFGFVLMGLEKKPNMRIQELLELKKVVDIQQQPPLASKVMMSGGCSRAERRAMERMNKGSSKKKKRK